MADLGHHFRNVHLQNLVEENDELRRRISKLTQIQGYVELLVEKLEKAQVKEKSIGNENNILRQQVRELEIKFANSQNMHGDQMRYVFSQHDGLVEEKNMAIMQLKAAVEKETSRAAHLENEARFQKANEQKLVSQYEEALIKYRNRVNELEQDLQIIYKSLEDEKFHHNKTKDTWISDANQSKQALQERDIQISRFKDEVNSLSSIKQKLQMETAVLVDFNQNIESKLALTEQETTNTIMQLRGTIDQLENQLNKMEDLCQNIRLDNANLQKQIEELKIVQAKLKEDNETYITDNQRLIFLLEESDKENLHLREKHRELEDYSSAEIEKLKIDNLRLREENNVLSKNNTERQNYLSTRMMELKEANAARDSLTVYFDQSQGQIVTLRGSLEEVQVQLLHEKKFSTQVDIERKNLAETVHHLKQQNMNTDDMLKRIQRQNIEISTENHNLSKILNNPREQNKDYVEQMDKVIKNFHIERQEQNKRHWVEKEKLKEMYEFDFRQKEMELTRQIAALQEELSKSTRLQILVEKQRNRPTATKTNYRTPNKL